MYPATFDPDDTARLVERDCAAASVPVEFTDPAALAATARLLRGPDAERRVEVAS